MGMQIRMGIMMMVMIDEDVEMTNMVDEVFDDESGED